MLLTLYVSNDMVLELLDVTNTTTDVIDEGATVTVTLVDLQGNPVSGETWPLSMPHVSGGLYRATLSDSIALVRDTKYRALIAATGSAGEVGAWEIDAIAVVRSGEC